MTKKAIFKTVCNSCDLAFKKDDRVLSISANEEIVTEITNTLFGDARKPYNSWELAVFHKRCSPITLKGG